MAFKIGTRNNSNINDVIELLNMTAQDFYKGKIQFVDRSYFSHLKANILSGIIDITFFININLFVTLIRFVTL